MAEHTVNSSNFVGLAQRTSATQQPAALETINARLTPHLCEVLRRVVTSAIAVGSVADEVKRALYYGKPFAAQSQGPDGQCVKFCQQEMLLWHAGLGLLTEACEFIETLASSTFDGQPLDEKNAVVELGDTQWYVAEASVGLDVSFDKILQLVIEKLAVRYKDKFTEFEAVNRDLTAERSVVEPQ